MLSFVTQIVLHSLQNMANFVYHLPESRIAIITQTIAAVAIVLRTSRSHVSLTQPLGLGSGSQHFALYRAVAGRVGVEFYSTWGAMMTLYIMFLSVRSSWKTSSHRWSHLVKLPRPLSYEPRKNTNNTSGEQEDTEARVHPLCCFNWTLARRCVHLPKRLCHNHWWGRDHLDGQEMWVLCTRLSIWFGVLRATSNHIPDQ